MQAAEGFHFPHLHMIYTMFYMCFYRLTVVDSFVKGCVVNLRLVTDDDEGQGDMISDICLLSAAEAHSYIHI